MMGSTAWNPSWVEQYTTPATMNAFRMVETQHVAATMRLVDTADEQDLLEQMLEVSKPPLPPLSHQCHYLLAAPFRYFPQTGSRFRALRRSGVWYGADTPFAACSEIAYWRQRFLLDSAGLVRQSLSTDLSMYEASVSGVAIDLLAPPWCQAQSVWQNQKTTAKHRSWATWSETRAASPGYAMGWFARLGMWVLPSLTRKA